MFCKYTLQHRRYCSSKLHWSDWIWKINYLFLIKKKNENYCNLMISLNKERAENREGKRRLTGRSLECIETRNTPQYWCCRTSAFYWPNHELNTWTTLKSLIDIWTNKHTRSTVYVTNLSEMDFSYAVQFNYYAFLPW